MRGVYVWTWEQQRWEAEVWVADLAKITRTPADGYAEYLEGKAQGATLGDCYLKDGRRVQAPGWAQAATQFEWGQFSRTGPTGYMA